VATALRSALMQSFHENKGGFRPREIIEESFFIRCQLHRYVETTLETVQTIRRGSGDDGKVILGGRLREWSLNVRHSRPGLGIMLYMLVSPNDSLNVMEGKDLVNGLPLTEYEMREGPIKRHWDPIP
jgi:hypothetical protein